MNALLVTDPAKTTAPVPPRRVQLGALVFAPVVVLNIAWFGSFPGRTLMGDDLDLLVQSRTPGGFANSLVEGFTQAGGDKFRPVVATVFFFLTRVFDGNFLAYRGLTLALHVLNVGLVGVLAWRLSKGSWIVAGAAMGLVTLSRFNVYFVLQVFGLMEGLTITFLLCMLLAVHRFYESGRLRPLALANLCYFLVIFTHERFIVLAPFLMAAILMSPAGLRLRTRVGWTVLPVAIAAFNIGVKSALLNINFFTGPGGTDVDLGPGQIVIFMERAALNIVGFNTGPDYLAGRNMHSLGALGFFLGAAFVLPICTIGILVARRWAAEGASWPAAVRPWLLGGSLLVPLLLSASIAFRQEYRWLFAPYVVLIVGLSWGLGRLSGRARLQALAALAVCAGGAVVDGYYRGHVENTYFFGGLRFADSVRHEIVERRPPELPSKTLFLVTHGDTTVEGWYLRNGDFFDVYRPESGADVRFAVSVDAARAEAGGKPFSAFEWEGDRVVKVPDPLTPGGVP